jgi:hypothetical protein
LVFFKIRTSSILNILASVIHAWPEKCPVRAKRTELKLFSGSDKWKREYDEVCWSLRLARVWSEAVGFALVRLVGTWLQHLLTCFHIQCPTNTFINVVLWIRYAKIMLQETALHFNKKCRIPSALTGFTTLVRTCTSLPKCELDRKDREGRKWEEERAKGAGSSPLLIHSGWGRCQERLC